MPIYEFQCGECGKTFEMLVFRSDDKVVCPECSCENVTRQMSVCGFKSGGDKGAASSRVASTSSPSGSSCAGCKATSCASCH